MSDGPFGGVRRFLGELKRRKVYRVGVTYAVVGFVVLQVVDIVFPRLGLPSWSVTLVIALMAVGFPLALVLAWAFEMTPEGVRRTEEASGEAAGGSAYAWLGLTLVVLAAGGIWYVMAGVRGERASPESAAAADSAAARTAASDERPSTPRAGERSIAVLPFETLSPGEDSETFARGIHDDLLTRLAHVSGLKVISRTAVHQFQGTDLTTGEVANSLGVRWVMEGGVQVLGDQIQVNAQLIDPRTETHAWADSYRRDLTTEDLFALQGEITTGIARSLEAELTPEEQEQVARQPTDNLDAYRLYVQGRSRLDTRSEEGMREAVDFFQRAIRQDSTYALAWSGLADAAGLYPIYGPNSIPDALPDQGRAARRALELAPDLAEAQASMGWAHWLEGNLARALLRIRRAAELKPSYAEAHTWLGWLHLIRGRFDEGRGELELAVELSPDHAAAQEALVWVRLAEGDMDAARRRADLLPERHPRTALVEAEVLYHEGSWERLRAVAGNQRDLEADPLWRFYRARLALLDGDTADARQHLRRIREMPPSDTHPLAEGLVWTVLGEHQTALRTWSRFLRSTPGPYMVRVRYLYSDVLGPLREDPRFHQLIREVNQYWGLNPDGSLPDSVDVSFTSRSDE